MADIEAISKLRIDKIGPFEHSIYKGSYMSAHVLLNLLNELGKRRSNARLAEHFIFFFCATS